MTGFRKILPWILAISALAASWRLYRSWESEPFLRGSDAYYYALQANYWAKTGEVKISDSSAIHRIIGSLQKTGLSTEAAVRLWESASLFLFFLLLLGLAWFPQLGISFAKAFVLLWAMASPTLLFSALEFPKFFLMLLALPLWFYPLAKKQPLPWLACLLAWATCLLHRGAVPLALAFSLGVVLEALQNKSRLGKKFWGGLALVAAATLLIAPLLADRFHLLDLQRLSWQAPRPGLWTLLGRQNLPWALKVEIPLSLLLFGILARHRLLPAAALFLPAIFPFGSTEVFGAGERYAILVPALAMIGILSSPRAETKENWPLPKSIVVLLCSAILPWLAAPRTENAHPRSIDPDFPSYAQVTAELANREIPMLIAQKGLVFFYKFRLMREAFFYEPEKHWNKSRLWRVTSQISVDELNYYAPSGCDFESGLMKGLTTPGYALLREDCWVQLRAKITAAENPDLYERAWDTDLNPSQTRPAFLYPKHVEDKAEEFPALPPQK